MSSLEHNPLQTMPKECPLCTKNIIRQRLSFDFEFFMCENIHCSFPFGNTEFEEYLIGDRTLPIQTKKLKKRKATSPDSAKSKLLKMKAPKTTLGNSQPSVVFVDDQIDTSINNNYFMADMESLLSTDQSLSVASNCKETPKAAGATLSYSLEDIEQLLNSSTQFDFPELDTGLSNVLEELNYNLENPTIA